MATLTFQNERFEWFGTYAENTYPKQARMRWDPARRVWWTADPTQAAQLVNFADDGCKGRLQGLAQQQVRSLAASRATDAQVDVPFPAGLAAMPFQRAGVAYALARDSVLFGDEMGLGKTIQAIGVLNADPTMRCTLVVCPAHLRLNWRNELHKWLVRPTQVVLADAKTWPAAALDGAQDVVVVCHYEAITRHQHLARGVRWDCLIVDEAHYCKNPRAQRTIAIVGGKLPRPRTKPGQAPVPPPPPLEPLRARRRIMMTGTPIPNRHVELWPILHYLDPARWPRFFGFAEEYCGAVQRMVPRAGLVWDFSGSSNGPKLQQALRGSIMVRRLKADVLTELPAKRRQVIDVAPNGAQAVVDAEVAAYDAHEAKIAELKAAAKLAKEEGEEAYAAAVAKLNDAVRVAFTEISKLRHDTAVAKVPAVLTHLLDVLEERSKVVLFAHHHDVVNAIRDGLTEAGHAVVVATGQESVEARTEAVRRFQEDPAVRVMIASIMGAGTGFTMTAASLVVFAELDWVPGNVTQAEDRCHRIGQRDSVLVQHLVFDGSLDARMAKVLVEKQAVADTALDTVHAPIAPPAPIPAPVLQDQPQPERYAQPAPYAAPAAQARPQAQAEPPAAAGLPDVPEGYYAIASATGNNDLDFFRVDRPDKGKWAGKVFVKRVIGGHPDMNLRYAQVPAVLERIMAAGPAQACALYGQTLGLCGVCGRHLTDETSRRLGIGPVCRAR